jgi:DNA-directed RNA polymerase specialized sigma subunit
MKQQQEKTDPIMQAYTTWKKTPTPVNMTGVIKAVDPVIRKALQTYGYKDDPLMRSTAQAYAGRIIPNYNPSKGTHLSTFLTTELQRLQRIGPQQSYAVPIPEGAALDLQRVKDKEAELRAALGRDPTIPELADATNMNIRRINKLYTKYGAPSLTEGFYGEDLSTAGEGSDVSEQIWADAVYMELDPIDKKIFEWTTGWKGRPSLSKTEIAQKLKMSVSAVTQRAAKITQKLNEGSDLNII